MSPLSRRCTRAYVPCETCEEVASTARAQRDKAATAAAGSKATWEAAGGTTPAPVWRWARLLALPSRTAAQYPRGEGSVSVRLVSDLVVLSRWLLPTILLLSCMLVALCKAPVLVGAAMAVSLLCLEWRLLSGSARSQWPSTQSALLTLLRDARPDVAVVVQSTPQTRAAELVVSVHVLSHALWWVVGATVVAAAGSYPALASTGACVLAGAWWLHRHWMRRQHKRAAMSSAGASEVVAGAARGNEGGGASPPASPRSHQHPHQPPPSESCTWANALLLRVWQEYSATIGARIESTLQQALQQSRPSLLRRIRVLSVDVAGEAPVVTRLVCGVVLKVGVASHVDLLHDCVCTGTIGGATGGICRV